MGPTRGDALPHTKLSHVVVAEPQHQFVRDIHISFLDRGFGLVRLVRRHHNWELVLLRHFSLHALLKSLADTETVLDFEAG